MTGYYAFIIIIVCLAICIRLYFKTEICICLPVSFNIVAVVLYLFGVLQILQAGIYVIISLMIIGIVFQKDRFKDLNCNDALVLGLFALMAFGFAMVHKGRMVYFADDLNHWALVTKKMYYAGRFAIFDPIRVEFAHYSELSSLPAYMALCLNSGWHEGTLYAVQCVWTCCMLFSLFYKKQEILQYVLLYCFVLIFPVIWGGVGNAYTTLQVDRLIGILIGYCLLTIFTDFENRNIKVLSLAVGTMTLTGLKESGLYFSLFILILSYLKSRQPASKKHMITTGFLVAENIFMYLSWKIMVYFSGVQINKNYWREFSIEALSQIIDGTDEMRHQMLVDSLYRLIRIDLFSWGANRSYLIWFVLVFIILLYLVRNEQRKGYIIARVLSVGMCVCAAWYIGIMYVIWFRFPDDQGLIGFDRYMDTIFISGVLFSSGMFFRETKSLTVKRTIQIIAVFSLLSASTVISNLQVLYTTYQNCFTFRAWTEDKIEMDTVRTMDPYTDKIYIVSQKDGEPVSSSYYQAALILAPIPINFSFSSHEVGDYSLSYIISANSSDNGYLTYYTPDQWREILKDYTYILMLNYDNDFIESYGDMFADEKISYGLYKINNRSFVKVDS